VSFNVSSGNINESGTIVGGSVLIAPWNIPVAGNTFQLYNLDGTVAVSGVYTF